MLGTICTHLGVKMPNHCIDPTKEESSSHKEMSVTLLFSDSHCPPFQDHNLWHFFPKVDINKFDDSDL
jgi:hypothetical protein